MGHGVNAPPIALVQQENIRSVFTKEPMVWNLAREVAKTAHGAKNV